MSATRSTSLLGGRRRLADDDTIHKGERCDEEDACVRARVSRGLA